MLKLEILGLASAWFVFTSYSQESIYLPLQVGICNVLT